MQVRPPGGQRVAESRNNRSGVDSAGPWDTAGKADRGECLLEEIPLTSEALAAVILLPE